MIQDATFWLVLTAAVPVYWLLKKEWRALFLAIVSFAFLFSTDPMSVCVLSIWALAFYATNQWTSRSSGTGRQVSMLIVAILGYLAFFKYAPPLANKLLEDSPLAKLAIPLGASYYTFKLIHYAIETSRGNITNRSLPNFLCYLFLFPIFTAGPIERFDHFMQNHQDKWDKQQVIEGLTRIAYGLIKIFVFVNIVIAPALKPFLRKKCQLILTNIDSIPPHQAWLFLILAFFEMYLSFSAYSDIAIGCSRLFGYNIAENFNYPFLSKNIGDFWKRWHMTLVSWLQSYVYMPVIGITRKPYLAVFVTFTAIGLWHAASINWLLWSLMHAAGVSVHLTWQRKTRGRKRSIIEQQIWTVTSCIFTFIFVVGSLCFIASDHIDATSALRLLAKCLFINI